MIRRNRKGTRTQDLWAWDVEDFKFKHGPLAHQEYLQQLIRFDPSNVDKIVSLPDGAQLLTWQYEHVRQFILQLNILVTQLKQICNKDSCPQMRSAEGIALCAAHKNSQQCNAMDYMLHNLDHATSMLFSDKMFGKSGQQAHKKYLEMILRRLFRILGHASFQHKQDFKAFQSEMHLSRRFNQFCRKYELLPRKLLGQ